MLLPLSLYAEYGKMAREIIYTMIGYDRISIQANLGDFTNQVFSTVAIIIFNRYLFYLLHPIRKNSTKPLN